MITVAVILTFLYFRGRASPSFACRIMMARYAQIRRYFSALPELYYCDVGARLLILLLYGPAALPLATLILFEF